MTLLMTLNESESEVGKASYDDDVNDLNDVILLPGTPPVANWYTCYMNWSTYHNITGSGGLVVIILTANLRGWHRSLVYNTIIP